MRLATLDALHWLDLVDPDDSQVSELVERYGFHELDREALLEENQRDRVDIYDHYLFLTLHFPKYNPVTKRYIRSEYNFFFSSDYLASVHDYSSKTFDRIFDRYQRKRDLPERPTTAHILYEIIDAMFDKTFRMLDKFTAEVRLMERQLFDRPGMDFIEDIMIKKRNIVTLKHLIKPQISVLKTLEYRINVMFHEEMEEYFESLQDKAEQISDEIRLLEENIDSMEDTLKSFFDLETNSTITYLTLFSAFLLPLTLLTSFFGMNLESAPFSDTFVFVLLVLTGVIMGLVIMTFARRKMKRRGIFTRVLSRFR